MEKIGGEIENRKNMNERTTFERLIRQIWPFIQRAINDVLSFAQRIVKAFIHIVREEL